MGVAAYFSEFPFFCPYRPSIFQYAAQCPVGGKGRSMRNLVRALFFVFPDVLLCWCEGFVIVFDVFLLRVNPLNSRGAEIGALTYGVPIDRSTICCLFFIHVPQYVVLLIRKKGLSW